MMLLFYFMAFICFSRKEIPLICLIKPNILGSKQTLNFDAFLFQMAELSKLIRDMKCILYGNSEAEPVAEACMQLTQEFFKENTLRLLINCLPKLNLEVCHLPSIRMRNMEICVIVIIMCSFYLEF